MKPSLPALILSLVGVPLLFACGPAPEPYETLYPLSAQSESPNGRIVEVREGVMGTRFVIEVYADSPPAARHALRAAWRRIYDLERLHSTWIADSLLSRVNRTAATRPVALDADTYALLKAARAAFRETSGAFDPTVGPLVALWRPLARLEKMPSDAAIEAARARVGFQRVHLDEAGRTVRFAAEGIALDVGGIAKGYAAEAACTAAREAGAIAARVNAGGDLACRGTPPHEPRGFPVTIRDPSGGPTDALPHSEFFLRNAAVATSGNYERYTEIAGKKYSHILDPRTGRPVSDAVVQVTVIAPDGARADALATALTVLGLKEGTLLAERLPGVDALFLVRWEEGYRRVATSGFPERAR